jgi:hypothetical protein
MPELKGETVGATKGIKKRKKNQFRSRKCSKITIK